jgi:hypothetical protein
MAVSGPHNYKIEPEFLGPFGDRPLAETARTGGPGDLFPGASTFLSARQQKQRREQWNAARTLAGRILRPDEHILYVAGAVQVPPALHALALGAFAMSYHQVVLVFTETRLIEVLLTVRGKSAGTRLRSYPWASVRDVKQSFSKLTMIPAQGKRQGWRIPAGGDRKLLKLLLGRLKPHFLKEGAARAEQLPLWHCPQCGAVVSANPSSCGACRTTFRSPRVAALLSLAFPGAGLFYAGHPFLGTLDLIGEVLLYGIFLMMLLETGPETLGAVAGIGAFLFLITKLESAHLSQILTARSKPEAESHRAGFKRFGLIGTLASLILIGGAFPLAGAARPVVDRDLDVESGNATWMVSRDTGEWEVFGDDLSARSQWRHPSGLRVTLFAYPQGMLEDAGQFRTQFRNTLRQQGVEVLRDDEEIPAPFRGFRFVGISRNDSGDPVSVLHYFVRDEENNDLHQAIAAVMQEDGELAEELVGDLLAHARWIAATAPTRPASTAAAVGR